MIIEAAWLVNLSRPAWMVLNVLVLVVIGALIYLGVDRNLRISRERELLQQRLDETEEHLAEAHQRYRTIFQISQMFTETNDQDEVVDSILRLSMELVGAKGASFVPLDERSQPLSALSVGEIPFPAAEAWLEYLASPAVRHKCGSCQNLEDLTHTCPLLTETFHDTKGVYCLRLRRGDQEYGVLNLYVSRNEQLDPEIQTVLRVLLDETTSALEGVRLRKRATSTLRQLQSVREKTNLNALFSDLLENLCDTLDADYALASIWDKNADQSKDTITFGELPDNTRPLIEGILSSVISSKEPLIFGKVTGNTATAPGFRALMAAPLVLQDQTALGVLLVANRQAKAFTNQQLSILQTVAGQAALVVHNINLMAQLEYRAIIDERTRLAREIHDGLAQTLGFLKLKSAQAQNYLQRGELDQLRDTLDTCYEVLSDAYQDARQAIDGLRVSPSEDGLTVWLHQTVAEFREYNDVSISFYEAEVERALAPEIQAQLIRIVQEALNNVRKHAHARNVEISCTQTENDMILEIRDDGVGFLSEDVPGPSQYGVHGMRERAELIGAEFQVISQPQEGTAVRIRMPVNVMEGEV